MTVEKHTLWTSHDAEQAARGHASSEWSASGVSIDTRTLQSGDLFVALHGPNFNGHNFVPDALARGAAAAMVDEEIESGTLLKVDDTMEALEDLGRAARQRTKASVIAITGSVGKTGTKEALKLVLSRQGETAASEGSLNNHWGLPLSLSRMPATADFGIFEMGMNHPGEIAPLSLLARPHVALITTVEPVHSEFFENENAIADAKAEIFTGLESGGAVVLNRDNRHFQRLSDAARARDIERIISFGIDDKADFRLLDAVPENGGTVIRADLGGAMHTYRLAVPGRHWLINSLGVLATVAAVGGHVASAAAALNDLEAPKGRGRFHRVHMVDGEMTLIDESYNASPVSMRAALQVLGQTPVAPGGRRIAVLGDMLELGDESPSLHAALAEVLADEQIDLVFTAGPDMAHLHSALDPAKRGAHAIDSQSLLPMVCEAVAAGDAVAVKGSAGSKTGIIVDALMGLGEGIGSNTQRVVNGD